jgi:signal transduction histidine kinase
MPAGRQWFAAPRRLLLLFTLVLLLPAIAVGWLGVRLIQQDRELEARQTAERRQTAADRAVAVLEQALASTERQLLAAAPAIPIAPGDDVVLVNFGSDGVQATPRGHLLYYPDINMPPTESDAAFEAGERLEFQQHDYAAAADRFRALARSTNASTKAGALLRLARTQRRLERSRDALHTYDQLSTLVDATVAGLPADLVGRRARCRLLSQLGLTADSARDARALRRDLLDDRWRLNQGTLRTYIAETNEWSGDDVELPKERVALAAAVEWFAAWRSMNGDTDNRASGRRLVRPGGIPVAVLWQSTAKGTAALVAGPAFQEREWFSVLRNLPEGSRLTLTIAAPDGTTISGTAHVDAAAKRTAAETGLPWTLLAGDRDSTDASVEFRQRRQTIVLALALLGVVVIAGGTFTLRAVSRELAAAQLQSDFVSAVSHEFRTPLTSLRQFTDLLNDELEPPPLKRRAFYQAQARATERLQRLVESLLDFGRMQAGVRPYRFTRTSLNDLVQHVVDDFRRDAAPEGFSVQAALPATPITIDADPEALTRAIWNLLDNAVKYSGESRIVRVEVSMQQQRAAVSVQDNGLGIPRDEQARIFQKFVRGAGTLERQIAGTGIGLAMVRHISRAHGGDVSVDSDPGRGSTFTLVVPLRTEMVAVADNTTTLDHEAADGGPFA